MKPVFGCPASFLSFNLEHLVPLPSASSTTLTFLQMPAHRFGERPCPSVWICGVVSSQLDPGPASLAGIPQHCCPGLRTSHQEARDVRRTQMSSLAKLASARLLHSKGPLVPVGLVSNTEADALRPCAYPARPHQTSPHR